MTFNDDANVAGSNARHRGRTAAVAGGGVVGLGAIAVLLISIFTGQDFTGLLGTSDGPGAAGEAGTAQNGAAIAGCSTGADANSNDTCRVVATSVVLDQYWAAQVRGYTRPQLVIVDGSAQSPCGTASNVTGPFYCPADQTVYIDPSFFQVLGQQFGASAGSLAQMYVLAHEYGHHVQDITEIMADHPNNGSGAASAGVRAELQADCFAGAWVEAAATQKDSAGVAYLKAPTPQQIDDALNAAAAVGDDHIQQQARMRVNPDTFTHGTSAQRQRWFTTGMQGGAAACDTFGVAGSRL